MTDKRTCARRRTRVLLGAVLPITLATGFVAAPAGATTADPPEQPDVESRVNDLLEIDGLTFRDLDGDGELDVYEDWREDTADRVEDLLGKMSIDEKTAMMLISTFNVGDAEQAAKEIVETHQRHFIVRDDPEPRDLAARNNTFQEIAEDTDLGIPVVFTSNPRNHVNLTRTFGHVEAGGQISTWPNELGLAAARDPEMVREFAEIAAREWRSMGMHKLYGYMADLLTEPRWTRTDGTFGEDPELAADYIREVILGFQGEDGLGTHSVAQTTKHFPGGGPRVEGTDPHHEWGSTNEYPTEGSLYEYHLPPFEAAIEAGTSSIMPYYAKPVNDASADQLPEHLWYTEDEQFEEVAFAYNEGILQDLLRDELGFEGYVNSDTGIVRDTDRVWGVEDLTVPERYAKAIDAGTNLFSGGSHPEYLREAVAEGLVTEDELDESLTYTLTEMYELGLFENPYVDPELAQEIGTSAESQAKADEAHLRSVVLLRNDELDGQTVLPITDEEVDDIRLYVEVFQADPEVAAEASQGLAESFRLLDPTLTMVDDPADATHAYLWVIPTLSWRQHDTEGSPPSIALRKDDDTAIDHERIIELQEQVETTILGVNFTNPWLVDDIEPGADAVISTFNTTPAAVVDVLRGEYNPTGAMPFTVPADAEAVDRNASDVPGYAEDFDYAYVDAADNEWGLYYGLDYEEAEEPEEPGDRTAEFHLSNTWRGTTDVVFAYGRMADDVYIGDWNGDGIDTIAVRQGNAFHISNAQQGGEAELVVHYGRAGDEVLVGDWNGDGTDTLAVRRGSVYHVKNSLTPGEADVVINYGRAGDEVLVGDWNADGQDTFAVRRGATYHVKNSMAGGDADVVFTYGRAGDEVLVGDWRGEGNDSFTVRRGKFYHVNYSLRGGDADHVVGFGREADEVYVGDWNGDGIDTLGIRRPL